MEERKDRKKVFVGMSGGVDSSVTAALLKERGFDVCGVHIKMWSDESIPCQFKEDRRDALRVAEKLGIPFETWDLTDEYRDEVVNYMIAEYAAGRTPNPDVMCNRKIKFGVFLQRAIARGADFIATGHYVSLNDSRANNIHARPILSFPRKRESRLSSHVRQEGLDSRFRGNDNRGRYTLDTREGNERFSLHIASDLNKDQSYFLWTLAQDQLKHCMFPLGGFTKPHVRELAQNFGLSTAEKPDSQGICFIGEIDLNNYLKRHIPEAPGRIVTTGGDEIGQHDGLAFYTIGQREGLGIGGGIPYYVAKKDFKTNTLIVAKGPFDEQLFASELTAHDAHWISGKQPAFPLKCKARIRYRQPLQKCTISLGHLDHDLNVIFEEPQRAVTPGQSIVFYDGDEMLGGALISQEW